MKTTILLILLLAFMNIANAQTTHTVQQVNFTFDPATITIPEGDSVKFQGTDAHPLVQVSEATWGANAATPLAGGFSLPSGSGTVGFLHAGTYFYVCSAHVASHQMKGKVIVTAATALDNPTSDKFRLFPVPITGNELSIALQTDERKQIDVAVFDLAGNRLIASRGNTVNGNFVVNCSSLPKGVYLIHIQSGENNYNTKFVRQ